MQKICEFCWMLFEAKRKTARFCSSKCTDAHPVPCVCDICWVKFMGARRTKYCSEECRKIWKNKNTEKTNIERYWFSCVMENEDIKKKREETNLKKFWVKNPMQSDKVKETMKKNNLEKYWVPYAQQSEEVKEIMKQSFLKKYWVEWPQQSKEIREKSIQTCLEKYWVDNTTKVREIREKMKQTNLEKYWVEYPFQLKEFRDKANNTNKLKYWKAWPAQIDSIKDKTIQTNLEKYWVPYYCMTDKCRSAAQTDSKINEEFRNILTEKWISREKEFPIENRSYDIKVWDTLIEIDPFPYHNLTWKPIRKDKQISKEYHKEKTILAKNNWYRCIHVFDWDDRNKIINLVNNNKETIYARKCSVKEITYEEAHKLFKAYHLQWDTKKNKYNMYIGLFYNWELIMAMSFGNARYNWKYEWEILRLCTHKDYSVIWWASKMLNHFLRLVACDSIISYCDMSKFDWSVYEQMWFKLLQRNSPSLHRWYTKQKIDWLPLHITNNLLNQRGFDQLLWKFFWKFGKWTKNEELMRAVWYVEIYDCWQATYVWHKEKEEK